MGHIGIPCVYGLDMNHGVTYTSDGTLFPQNINVGASFNPSLARAAAEVTAYETRASMPEWELREKCFVPFKAAVEAGALTVMVNSASVNGIPVHANKTLLTDWLKDGLNWDGMIVSDWADIDNLWQREHVAKDKKEAIAMPPRPVCGEKDLVGVQIVQKYHKSASNLRITDTLVY